MTQEIRRKDERPELPTSKLLKIRDAIEGDGWPAAGYGQPTSTDRPKSKLCIKLAGKYSTLSPALPLLSPTKTSTD